MNYVIREAIYDDIYNLKQLEESCFDEKIRENFEFVLKSSSHKYLVVIDESNNKIVGYAGVSISYEQGDILSVCVQKDYRNKGFAFMLINRLVEIIKPLGVEKLFLEVEQENVPAINLYKKLGFSLSYIRKNYYGDKSALIMVKEL